MRTRSSTRRVLTPSTYWRAAWRPLLAHFTFPETHRPPDPQHQPAGDEVLGVAREVHPAALPAGAAGNDEGSAWPGFIRALVERGLHGVRLVISDDHRGLVRAVHEQLPRWSASFPTALR